MCMCVCPCCGVRSISQIMTQFCYQIGSNVIFVSVEWDRNVCNWQYIKLLVHFRKLLTLVPKMAWSSPLTISSLPLPLCHENQQRSLKSFYEILFMWLKQRWRAGDVRLSSCLSLSESFLLFFFSCHTWQQHHKTLVLRLGWILT